jgi:hypothetical protein
MDPPSSQTGQQSHSEHEGRNLRQERLPPVCLEPARTLTSAQRFMEYWLTHCATISPTGARVYISSTSEIWRKLIVTEAKTYGDSRLRTQDNLYRDLAKVGRTRNSSNTKSDVASGMDPMSCAAESRCPTFASITGSLNMGLVRIDLELRPNITQKIHARFAIYTPRAGRTQFAPRTGTAGNHCGDPL